MLGTRRLTYSFETWRSTTSTIGYSSIIMLGTGGLLTPLSGSQAVLCGRAWGRKRIDWSYFCPTSVANPSSAPSTTVSCRRIAPLRLVLNTREGYSSWTLFNRLKKSLDSFVDQRLNNSTASWDMFLTLQVHWNYSNDMVEENSHFAREEKDNEENHTHRHARKHAHILPPPPPTPNTHSFSI